MVQKHEPVNICIDKTVVREMLSEASTPRRINQIETNKGKTATLHPPPMRVDSDLVTAAPVICIDITLT